MLPRSGLACVHVHGGFVIGTLVIEYAAGFGEVAVFDPAFIGGDCAAGIKQGGDR